MKIVYFSGPFTTYSLSANARQKPLGLATHFDLTLIQARRETLPAEQQDLPLTHLGLFPSECPAWKEPFLMASRWLRTLRRLNEQGQVDAVAVAFDAKSLCLGWLAKKLLKRPLIVFCWDPPGIFWRDRRDIPARLRVGVFDFLFRKVTALCDLLVLNIEQGVLEEIGAKVPEEKLLALPNGICVEKIVACAEGIEPDPWLLGLQSAVRRQKNFDKLKKLFIEILVREPRASILWVGDCPEDLRLEMQQALSEHHIEAARLVMTGLLPQEEALRKLATAGVVLHYYPNQPSVRWNCPLKIGEYMALGRCVAAVDLPGVRMYQNPSDPALTIFPNDDPRQAIDEILPLLGDTARQQALGQKASEQAERFDWTKLNRQMADRIKQRVESTAAG